MAAITTITGAAWPTSGTATAGTTGLNTVSSFTHVGADASDLWPGASGDGATGYLKGTTTANAYFRIDAAGITTAAGAKYVVSYWLRARLVNPTLPNRTTLDTFRILDLSGGNHQFITNCSLIKKATGTAGYSGLAVSVSLPATVSAVAQAGTATNAFGNTLTPVIPFDRWVRVTHWHRQGAAGTAEHGTAINGQVIGRCGTSTDTIGTVDTTTNTPMTDANANNFYMGFGGVGGWTDVEFQIGGLQSWSSTGMTDFTDAPSANTSRLSTPSRYDLYAHWPVWCLNTGAQEGGNWGWTDTSGTPTRTMTSYASSGTHPWRTRFKVLRSGANDTGELLSTRQVGTLPYNNEGWATLYFPMILMHGSATIANIDVLASNNTTVLHRITAWGSIAGITYDNGSGAVDTITDLLADYRYSIALHLNSDGRAAVTVFRLTDDASGTWGASYTTVKTVAVDNWTPASLGKIKVSLATPDAGDYIEFDGMSIHRYLTLAGVDSYTQANSATASPTMSTVNTRVPLVYPVLREAEGPACPGFFIPTNTALPVWAFAQSIGWSGFTMANVVHRNGRALRSIPGARLVIFSGITNDLAGATTPALAQSLATTWANNVVYTAQGMVASDSALALVCAPYGTGSNFNLADAPAMFVAGYAQAINGLATKFDQRGLVHVYPGGGTTFADVHPTEAESATWQASVQAGIMALQFVKRRRPVP